MSWLTQVPEWFGAAIVGAIFATLGYLSKAAIDWWKKRNISKASQRKRLQELESLLLESNSLFLTQNELARRLFRMLEENHTGELPEKPGFERAFEHLQNKFSREEEELHSIIRGITMNSLRRVNEAMSEWLTKDLVFKTGNAPTKKSQELAKYLVELEHHLNLWHDKYKVWIPDKQQHALVYLADEEGHGIRFPVGIEKVVSDMLQEFK